MNNKLMILGLLKIVCASSLLTTLAWEQAMGVHNVYIDIIYGIVWVILALQFWIEYFIRHK